MRLILNLLVGVVLLSLAGQVELSWLRDETPKPLDRILPKSRGQVFPKPQSQITTDTQHRLDEHNFEFQFARGSHVCDVLSLAFNRYYKIIFRPHEKTRLSRQFESLELHQDHRESFLKRVIVDVKEPCQDYPSLESDESCS